MDLIDLTTSGILSTETEEKIFQKGKKLLKENPFFRDLDSIMSQTEFRAFYDKYFNDISDMKTVLMYMKLYEELQLQYRENGCHSEKEKEVLVYMIKEFISNRNSRHMIVRKFSEYFSGKRSSLESNTVPSLDSNYQIEYVQAERHTENVCDKCKAVLK